MNINNFVPIAGLVIDNLEGGYYNPLMIGRAVNGVKDSIYFHAGAGRKESGETMFGLDRANGGTLNTGTYGKAFWSLIDSQNAKYNWPYDYHGGSAAPQLKDYLGKIMFPQYDYLSRTYLTPKAQAIVDADPRLEFHFGYATWNGSGFFQNFAQPINDAVNKGITNPDTLAQIAIDSRTNNSNELIRRSAGKILDIMNSLGSFAAHNPIVPVIGLAAIGAALYWYKNRN